MRRNVPWARLEGSHDGLEGLSGPEAAARLERHGANTIIPTRGRPWAITLRDTLQDPMLWFLLITSLLFWIVGQHAEALVLLLALIPLMGMDIWLHRRTQASVQGLSGRLAVQARVWRDGEEQTLPVEQIVPGDLVVVGSGDSFPADGLLVRCDGLQVDESILTGEAYPVRKQALTLPSAGVAQTPVEDCHWGLAGTRVLTGTARLRVVFTGAETLYGEIVRSAITGAHPLTPLQHAVARLVKVLLVAAAAICVMLAWLRYHQGYGLLDAVISALTLAVAALPEEFPVVLAIFLGAGVYRLARRRALVRRAVVVENIGRVTCICSDKTGTLTEGRLQLTHTEPASEISGNRLLEIAAAASRRDGGDPVDEAVFALVPSQPELPPFAMFPFTEARRRETSVREQAGALEVAVKGAPEVILDLCTLSADARRHWMDKVNEYAGSGHKLIACAQGRLDAGQWTGEEPEQGLSFAGLLAFEDPVREGVREAVQACRAAGIHVIMVTGDHPHTALAIAREIGLGTGEPRLITGDELAQHTVQGQALIPQDFDVIARAIPAQKLAMVRGLQAAGEIVAVTGDGINDVPALQAADVGIAMGERGTQSAREVASVVLMDDNFRSIVGAVSEGRQLFTNLQLSFLYLLMIHIPLVATAALIPLLGYPLLYLPIHIVWLELIIHPTALLVFQNLQSHHPLGPPPSRGIRERFFDNRQWWSIVLVGGIVTLLVLGTYIRSLGADHDVDHARTMALLTLIMAGAGITATLSNMRGIMAWSLVVGSPALAALFIFTPVLRELLHLHPLHWDDWLIALAGGALTAGLVHIGVSKSRSRPRPYQASYL